MGNLYIPGASNATYEYGAYQMWTYKINKKTGSLLVESNYDEVSIKSVSINGKEVTPDASNVYEFEPSDEVTVSVVFEAFGSNSLTTIYDAAFNAGLEDEDVAADITNIFSEEKDEFTIYTISGMRQVMKKNELKSLSRGIYIIDGKKYAVK